MKLSILYRVAAVLAALALPALAQVPVGYVQVTAANVTDSAGVPLPNGTISFAPTNSAGQPISYQINGNGQALSSPVTSLITSGAFSIRLADTTLTNPANVCFSVKITDNTNGKPVLGSGYGCFQPAGYGPMVSSGMCTAASPTAGGTCSFDKFTPNLPGVPLTGTGPAGPVGPTGPAGPTGSTGPPVSWTGTYSSSTAYTAGQGVYYSTDGNNYTCNSSCAAGVLPTTASWTRVMISTQAICTVRTVSANDTATTTDCFIRVNPSSGSSLTETLPATPATGQVISIKNIGAGSVTVNGNGHNIDGSPTFAFAASTFGQPTFNFQWDTTSSTWNIR